MLIQYFLAQNNINFYDTQIIGLSNNNENCFAELKMFTDAFLFMNYCKKITVVPVELIANLFFRGVVNLCSKCWQHTFRYQCFVHMQSMPQN